jgi:hypothetical protein
MIHDLRPYGPGRFSTVLDCLVFNVALDGCDAELGAVEENGEWFGRLNAPLFTEETWQHTTEAERDFLRLNGAGAILSEDVNGFAYVEYFPTSSALTIAWSRLEVHSGLEYVPLVDDPDQCAAV